MKTKTASELGVPLPGPASALLASLQKVKYRVEPLNKWVAIRKIENEDKVTAEGVIVKGGKSSRGEVIAAAEGVPLKAGDMVIYTNFPIELEDLEMLTQDPNIQLVRFEEVYTRLVPCT